MNQDNKPLNIKILTTEAFPIGFAATNRIMCYAKGLAEQNCTVSVYCIKPSERPGKEFNKLPSGIINGFPYYYSGGKTRLDPKFLIRRLDNIKGIVKMCALLAREKQTEKTDAVIYYSTSTSSAFLLYVITKMKNILYLKEISEFPSVFLKDKNFLQRVLFNKMHYKLFDGSLIMTKRLIQYFVAEKKSKKPYLHVPMTVDFERFSSIQKKGTQAPYIAYCGVLNNDKDGIDILIDAFAMIANEFPAVQLYLIGEAATKSEQDLYVQQISRQNLSGRVVFTGRLTKDEIPLLLVNAKMLVLPRPPGLQAEGGFPTKLGEYLATGNPVVVTKVGEIPDYLADQVNAFMAEPGDTESLAAKMRSVLRDYEKALIIGEEGKQVVMKHFNYKVQAKDLIHFIKKQKSF